MNPEAKKTPVGKPTRKATTKQVMEKEAPKTLGILSDLAQTVNAAPEVKPVRKRAPRKPKAKIINLDEIITPEVVEPAPITPLATSTEIIVSGELPNWEPQADRFDQLLAQFHHPKLQAGMMPEEWTTTIQLKDSNQWMRPGSATINSQNKVIISCKTPEQKEFLRNIFLPTDPKQNQNPITTPAGYLKHFRHIAGTILTPDLTGEKTLAKLVKLGEICCAYLEILEQNNWTIQNQALTDIERPLDIRVLGMKAELLAQNGQPAEQDVLGLSSPITNGNPLQLVLMPGPNGTQYKLVCINPQISLNYWGKPESQAIGNLLKKKPTKQILTWVGIGVLLQIIAVLAILAYRNNTPIPTAAAPLPDQEVQEAALPESTPSTNPTPNGHYEWGKGTK